MLRYICILIHDYSVLGMGGTMDTLTPALLRWCTALYVLRREKLQLADLREKREVGKENDGGKAEPALCRQPLHEFVAGWCKLFST